MTKEKGEEKIMLVLDKTILHVIKDYEYLIKKSRESLKYELQEMRKKESKRKAVDHEKSKIVNFYIIAQERLKSLRDFARMMLTALNIDDPFDEKYNEIKKKEAEALEKLISKQFDADTELEKIKDKIEKLPEENPGSGKE